MIDCIENVMFAEYFHNMISYRIGLSWMYKFLLQFGFMKTQADIFNNESGSKNAQISEYTV